MARAERNEKRLFEKSNNATIVSRTPEGNSHMTFFYILNADIDTSSTLTAAFETLRSAVKVVRIYRPWNWNRTAHDRPEIDVLAGLTTNPNIVEMLGHDDLRENWASFEYVGPTLEIIDDFRRPLPQAFIRTLFKDIGAGLAFLHWGIPPTWTQRARALAPNPHWNPIAYNNVDVNSISLSLTDWHPEGTPLAKLTDFTLASTQPRDDPRAAIESAERWTPARQDMADAAHMLHFLTHGNELERSPEDRRQNVCACLDDFGGQKWWLTPQTNDPFLTRVFEVTSSAHDTKQHTSLEWVVMANTAAPHMPPFPGRNALAESDIAKLREQLPRNSVLRAKLSHLQNIYEGSDDTRIASISDDTQVSE